MIENCFHRTARSPRSIAPTIESASGTLREADVYRRRCKVSLFEKESVSKNHGSVKGQTRFGAIPADEFVDGMSVGFLRTWGCERLKDGSLRLLQIGQAKYGFGLGFGASRYVAMDEFRFTERAWHSILNWNFLPQNFPSVRHRPKTSRS